MSPPATWKAPQPNSQATRSTTNSVINITSPRSFPICVSPTTAQPATPGYDKARAGSRVSIAPGAKTAHPNPQHGGCSPRWQMTGPRGLPAITRVSPATPAEHSHYEQHDQYGCHVHVSHLPPGRSRSGVSALHTRDASVPACSPTRASEQTSPSESMQYQIHRTPISPRDVSALWSYAVSWDAATPAQRMDRRHTPDGSERLRDLGDCTRSRSGAGPGRRRDRESKYCPDRGGRTRRRTAPRALRAKHTSGPAGLTRVGSDARRAGGSPAAPGTTPTASGGRGSRPRGPSGTGAPSP